MIPVRRQTVPPRQADSPGAEPAPDSPRLKRGWFWVWTLLAAAALCVLFFFNPGEHGFYPFCTFYKTTGLLCPGCGSLRAMHQLLHGHVETAFRLNPLLMVCLPFLAWHGLKHLWRRWRHQPGQLGIAPKWIWTGMGVLLLFGVVRNVPQAMAWLGTP